MANLDPSSRIQQLTAAIASGDSEAFGRFYDEWFDRALAEARRCTGRDESFCLDVVQDAMLRAIKSMKPLPHEAALFRWLRVVIRSCACDRIRSELRRRHREVGRPDETRRQDTQELADRMQWIHEQFEYLDEADVTLLIMRHRFGWTLARIGATLGLGHGAVDKRLRRIVGVIKQRAKEDFDGLSTF